MLPVDAENRIFRQLLSLIRQLTGQSRYHGALSVENIVLAPTASFGVLAAHILCQSGRLWLRKDPQSPVKPDARALADVLGTLVDMEAQIAALQTMPMLLPPAVRQSIHELLRTIADEAL